jgi:recombination protein RecA
MDNKEKKKLIKAALKKITKETGEVFLKTAAECNPVTYLATPFDTLNTLTGGGFPVGKFSTVAGAERTGKGTLIAQTLGHNQTLDPSFTCLWTDAEDAIDLEWMTVHGIDPERLYVQKYSEDTPNFEKLLDNGIDLISTGAIDMWVIDSVAALLPKAEANKAINEDSMLDLQRKLPLFFRKASRIMSTNKVTCILVGQIYNVPNANYVQEEVKGGNALKHWAHLRLKTRRGNRAEGPTAIKIMAPDGEIRQVVPGWAQHLKLDKTRANEKEGQEIVLQFVSGRGLDSIAASITALLASGEISRRGAYYYHELFPGDNIQGKEALVAFLKEEPEIRKKLTESMDKSFIENKLDLTKEEV